MSQEDDRKSECSNDPSGGGGGGGGEVGIRGLLSIDRRILGVLWLPIGDFLGKKIWQVFFCVWLQIGRDFRDKSRMYYASKIRSRLVS